LCEEVIHMEKFIPNQGERRLLAEAQMHLLAAHRVVKAALGKHGSEIIKTLEQAGCSILEISTQGIEI